MVQQITKYGVDGKEFNTLDEARKYEDKLKVNRKLYSLIEFFYYERMPIEEIANNLVEQKDRVMEILKNG